MSTHHARSYWQSQKTYPFPFTRRRRLHELNYLVPRLQRPDDKRLLDLGCGDGSLLECLLRVTDFEQFWGFDVSEVFLAQVDPRISTAVYDMTAPGPLPEVDVTIIAGAIQYIFEDDAVLRLLSHVSSPRLFVRSTCTLLDEDERIVRDDYASNYRTLPRTHALLHTYFRVTAIDRVYPDEIESPFGTKQFYFECHRR